jgi:hypothetical protein
MNQNNVAGTNLEVLMLLTSVILSHLSFLYFVHMSKLGFIDSSQIITAASFWKFKTCLMQNISIGGDKDHQNFPLSQLMDIFGRFHGSVVIAKDSIDAQILLRRIL